MIDVEAVRIVLDKMPDGFLFEEFAHKILSLIVGDTFQPVGGKGDRGVDGFQHVYHKTKHTKLVYQISTEQVHWKQSDSKITTTMDKLIRNGVEVDQLYFVTSRKVDRKETIQSNFYEKYEKPLTIYDSEWFIANISSEPKCADVYTSFVDNHVHEYVKPGKEVEVGDFSGDPRLYVFLRQHVDESGGQEIEDSIIDGLILFSLEGTASEQEEFKTKDDVINNIRSFFNFDFPDLSSKVENRLSVLSKKPISLVKHHTKEDNYCLPYETRLELNERDIKDTDLQQKFVEETTALLESNLSSVGVNVKDVYSLFESILHQTYYRLGLEFSDFILNNTDKDDIDDSLGAVVARVVDDSKKVIENKSKIKTAILISFREIAYNGSETQREFLRRLSNTYMMIFLTQNDPKISSFFSTLANKLDVFVGTSIIVPALSEFFLSDENKRYWNLLKGASSSGVSLKVNEYIVDELVSHIEGVKNQYLSLYQSNESEYLEDDVTMLYIDEILIRAYFYAKKRGRINDFDSFLFKFVDPSLSKLRSDIIFFLKEVFGIEYVTTSSQDIQLDAEEVKLLTDQLVSRKRNSKKKAEVDAKLILHIYKLREKNNETNTSGIFGYKTWWLSQDINTFKAVQDTFGNKYDVNCYMRADFMYKYIALSPHKADIDNLYKECFPSLLGVNLSYHIPQGISEYVGQKITEHKDTDPTIVKRILKSLTEKIMSNVDDISTKDFKSYFDEELQSITKGD